MFPLNWIHEAQARISPHIRETPLTYDSANGLYLKWENHQVTGSFKARGALNKVLAMQDWERQRGLVTASAGNHGQGVALAGKLVAAPVLIFASEHAVPAKVEAMQALGAEVHLTPGGYGEAEQAAIAYAQANNASYVSPYNDGLIIAGQGTLAIETLRQNPAVCEATWLIPVGGGGLASGIGAVMKSLSWPPGVIGVQSEASPFFHSIFLRGSQRDIIEYPSLADGLAGPVEEGSITIPLVKHFCAQIQLVTEAEINEAISFAWKRYGERIEGSAAAALAAALSGKIQARPALIIISGGNIQPSIHEAILNNHPQSTEFLKEKRSGCGFTRHEH